MLFGEAYVDSPLRSGEISNLTFGAEHETTDRTIIAHVKQSLCQTLKLCSTFSWRFELCPRLGISMLFQNSILAWRVQMWNLGLVWRGPKEEIWPHCWSVQESWKGGENRILVFERIVLKSIDWLYIPTLEATLNGFQSHWAFKLSTGESQHFVNPEVSPES